MLKHTDYHLFDNGGADSSAGGVANTSTDAQAVEEKKPVENVEATGSNSSQVATDKATESANQKQDFKSLIEERKDEFDDYFQERFNKRFKSYKEDQAKLKSFQGVIDALANQYGTEDVTEILRNIEINSDDFKDEALERGLSTDELLNIKTLERENKAFKEQMEADRREKEEQETYQHWLDEAEQVKTKYPDFDLETEAENEEFVQYLSMGKSVEQAYIKTHAEEFIAGAVKATAEQAKKQTEQAILSGSTRVSERTNSVTTNPSKVDFSKFTTKDFEEIDKRAMRGDKITFK